MASKLLAALLILSSTSAYAECDFATGIEKLPDGRYAYSVSCHKAVGKLVADAKDHQEELAQKDIQIKNLGVQMDTQEKRAQLWMDTSFKLEDRVNQMEALRSTNQWIYFGIGMVTTGIAVWGAGHLKP